MPRAYSTFRPLYPPRTESLINPQQLSRYKGFVVQYKYNDIRTVTYLLPGGRIEMTTRQLEPHREFVPGEPHAQGLRSLKLAQDKFQVLDGGVLRDFTGSLGNPIILWDILVHDSVYLTGTTYRERYAKLVEIFGNPKEPERETGATIALTIPGSARCPVWLAPILKGRPESHYAETLENPYLEGLLLKDPHGKLEPALGPSNNGRWQIKVRKPATAYMF